MDCARVQAWTADADADMDRHGQRWTWPDAIGCPPLRAGWGIVVLYFSGVGVGWA